MLKWIALMVFSSMAFSQEAPEHIVMCYPAALVKPSKGCPQGALSKDPICQTDAALSAYRDATDKSPISMVVLSSKDEVTYKGSALIIPSEEAIAEAEARGSDGSDLDIGDVNIELKSSVKDGVMTITDNNMTITIDTKNFTMTSTEVFDAKLSKAVVKSVKRGIETDMACMYELQNVRMPEVEENSITKAIGF